MNGPRTRGAKEHKTLSLGGLLCLSCPTACRNTKIKRMSHVFSILNKVSHFWQNIPSSSPIAYLHLSARSYWRHTSQL